VNGWIKLHKSILDWEWHDHPNVISLFIHCLFNANYEDKKWHGILIKKGSFITGRKKLAKATGLSEQQIRTTLQKLVNTKNITITSTNKYSVITIVNWGKYQGVENKITNKSPTNNQQITTTKNIKNIKNSNKTYGEYKNVLLTDKQFDKLKDDFPDYPTMIKNLDEYIETHGKKYKNHNLVMRNWKNKDKSKTNDINTPIWFDNKITKEEATKEDKAKLNKLLEGFK